VGETTDASGTLWYQVYVDENTTGYIRGDLLKTSASSTTESTNVSNSTETKKAQSGEVKAASGTGTVTWESINIRNDAVDGDVLCTLQKGAVVTVTGEKQGSDGKKWYQVSFVKNSQSYIGYVRADLLDLSAKAATQTDSSEQSEATSGTEEAAQGTENTTENADGANETTEVAPQVGSGSAYLEKMVVSNGTLTPEFTPDIYEYTISTTQDTTSISISASAGGNNAQIISADGFSNLTPGVNAASIVVKAGDGTTQTYQFSIVCGQVAAESENSGAETEAVGSESAGVDTEVAGETTEIDAGQNEGAQSETDFSEIEKYKKQAQNRLVGMCVLAFLLAVCVIIILNLVLKIHDMTIDGMDEERVPAKSKKRSQKAKAQKTRKKREYVKLDDEAPALTETLTQKEQAKRAEQRAQKSVFMPDLREEQTSMAESAVAYGMEDAYEDTGLDDDFEFEFINLDVKR